MSRFPKTNLAFVSAVLLFLSLGCTINQFDDGFENLRGEYTWISSTEFKRVGFSYQSRSYDASYFSHTAEVIFRNDNEVVFIIDGQEYLSTKFRIEEATTQEGDIVAATLWVKNKDEKLKSGDEMNIRFWGDTLDLSDFPHRGYSGLPDFDSNYFVRK